MIVGLLMLGGGAAAGLFGSLLGLGGGILIVPLLAFGFDVPLREAIGVSLVAVIIVSGASSGVFLARRVANLRLAMYLEAFAATGALVGGFIAFLVSERFLAGLFAVLMGYVAVTMIRTRRRAAGASAGGSGPRVGNGAASGFVDRLSGPDYRVHGLVRGAAGSVGAGVAAALLGLGGGLVNVPVMNLAMGVPLRVATATSILMVGITASAAAVIYLIHGEIDPYIAGPTGIGVFLGATLGSRIAHRIDLGVLRMLFVVVLLYTAVQMTRRALGIA